MGIVTRYLLILSLLFGTLLASTGLNQGHLLDYAPKEGSRVEYPNISCFFQFDREIDGGSVKDDTIELVRVSSGEKVEGRAFISDKKRLEFEFLAPLETGEYRVGVKPVWFKGDIEQKSFLQRLLFRILSLFYDDPADSYICKLFCQSKGAVSKPISYGFFVSKGREVIDLKAESSLVELPENNGTTVRIIAVYDGNETDDVTKKARYESSDDSVSEVDEGVILSRSEGSAVITASYGGKSTTIRVEVYETVDGHLLPHAPKDPDSTLLGVDANGNGVRDDVERWIYKEMPTYHHPQIERVIAMQRAKAYTLLLKDPSNKNDQVHNTIVRSYDCWAYYSISRNLPFDGAIEKFGNLLRDKQFNTKERLKTYMEYDYSLKGRVFASTPFRLLDTSYCDENIDQLP